MDTRTLGGTGWDVTEVGLGTWTVGPSWGAASDEAVKASLRAALDAGTNLIDTADVYGDGRAERLVGEVLAEADLGERVYVLTKAGRQLRPHEASRYDRSNLEAFVDESRERLGQSTLDLVQLHCPPTETYYQPETFEALEALRDGGKVHEYGVSVETVEEGLKAIEYDGVQSVQIIFNPLRQRPAERFFERAAAADVGVVVRVPLASGLLADAFDEETSFPADDHRGRAVREGVDAGVGAKGGETFAGVPFGAGLDFLDEVRPLVPDATTMAQYVLRWILDFDAVTTVIPGSTDPAHVEENAAAADLDSLSHREHGAMRDAYEAHVCEHVHHRW
jgi:aryl-alcohol dehydrogenase-like predicted oxidoreductase